MNDNTKNQIYTFGGFRVDPLRRLLFRPDGETVALKPKVFDTLLCLIEHAGGLVSKTDLMEAVWGNRIVEENSLSKHISTLRHVLGETPGEHRFIVTEPGHGYRFVATVSTLVRSDADDVGVQDELSAAGQMQDALIHTGQPPVHPPTLRRTGAYAIAAVACSALLAGLWWDRSSELAPPDARTIAVLAFSDLSPDGDQAIFAEGMTIDLAALLGRAPSLRVTAANSALSFRDSDASYAEIAEVLGAEYLLIGAVTVTDASMRVTASLVEVGSEIQVWSYPAESRSLTDIFAVQNEIASGVAESLGSTFEKLPARYVTNNLEVQAAYRQAQHVNRNMFRDGLPRARELLEQAIRDDPNYLPARLELVTTLQNLHNSWQLSATETRDQIRAVISAAASIWQDDPKINARRGWMASAFDGDYETAVRFLQRAIDGAPGDLEILGHAQAMISGLNRQDDAIAIGEYILARDPICYYCQVNLQRAYFVAQRYDDAEQVYARARSLGLDHFYLRETQFWTLLSAGKSAPALEELEATELPPDVLPWARLQMLAFVLWDLGRSAEFEKTFDELQAQGDDQWTRHAVASVFAYIGDVDKALDIFMELPEEIWRITALDGRLGDALRDHDRYEELAARVGIWPNDPRDAIDFRLNLPQ